MTLAVADEVVGEENGNEHDGDLELVQGQVHVLLIHAPADDDEERNEEQSNLHAGTNGDANGEVHLILDGDGDGGGVLGGVADDGQQDQADKLLAQSRRLSETVDGVDHELGAERDNDGGDEEGSDGHKEMQLGVVLLIFLLVNGRLLVLHGGGVLVLVAAVANEGHARQVLLKTVSVSPRASGDLFALLVEDVEMGVELEEQVRKVHQQQDHGGAARQLGDFRLGGIGLEIEDGGDDDGGNGQGEEGGGRLSDGGVEVLLGTAQAAKEEAESHDEQQVGQDGADERGLDDDNLTLDESEDGDDELDSIAKGGVDEAAEGLASAQGNLFRGEAKHGGEGDDGDEVDGEDDGWADAVHIVERNADRRGDKQDVDPGVEECALQLVGDGEGMLGVHRTVEGVLLGDFGLAIVVVFWGVADCLGGVIGFAIPHACATGGGGVGCGLFVTDRLVLGDLGKLRIVVWRRRGRVGPLLGRRRSVVEVASVAFGF